MKTYLIAYYSTFDGDGQSIKIHKVEAEDPGQALVRLFSSQGWTVEKVEDLEGVYDVAWSEPIEMK